MTLKTSFKKAFACFCACVLMLYSLITAPCFGVHATSVSDTFSAVADFVSDLGGYAIENVLEGTGVVGSFVGNTLLGVVDTARSIFFGDDFNNPLSSVQQSVDLGATIGFSGFATVNNIPCTVSAYTLPSYTFTIQSGLFDPTDFPSFRVLRFGGVGFTADLSISYFPDLTSGESNQWQAGDYYTISSTYSKNPYELFKYSFTFYDSSNNVVSRAGYFRFIYHINNQTSYVSSPLISPNHFTYDFQFYNEERSYDLTNYLDPKRIYYGNYSAYEVGCFNYNNERLPSVGRGQEIAFPSYGSSDNTINIDNFYDYLNTYSYPLVINQYPVWRDYPSPSSFIPSDPVYTSIPDGTGVIIIDPFTLPPEWVQSDVVELHTDHYTVPYEDMVDEPFDYLAGLGTYPNPPTPALNALKRSETSTVTRAVSVDEGSPPLIWDLADYETKTALTDYFLFAENLLHDTGLYNLVGSLIAVGIIVSLV